MTLWCFLNNTFQSNSLSTHESLIEIQNSYKSRFEFKYNQIKNTKTFNSYYDNYDNYYICDTISSSARSILKFASHHEQFEISFNVFENSIREIYGLILSDKLTLNEVAEEEFNSNRVIDLKNNYWGVKSDNFDFKTIITVLSSTFLENVDFEISPFFTNYDLSETSQTEIKNGRKFLIKDHTVWNSSQIINRNVVILDNASLTINPGVKVSYYSNVTFYSFGPLILNGTTDHIITFEPVASIRFYDNCFLNSESILFYLSNLDSKSQMINSKIVHIFGFNYNIYSSTKSSIFLIENSKTPLLSNIQLDNVFNAFIILKNFDTFDLKNVTYNKMNGNFLTVMSENFDINLNENKNETDLVIDLTQREYYTKIKANCFKELFIQNQTDYFFALKDCYLAKCYLIFQTFNDSILNLITIQTANIFYKV